MATTGKTFKWRTLIGLFLVGIAFWFDLSWVWAILFLIWVIPDLFTGVTHFMEPIHKKENPLFYWLIMAIWLLMSGYMLVDAFAPQLLPDGWSSSNYSSIYETQEDGVYSFGTGESTSENAILQYKSYVSDAFNIVGISTKSSYDPQDMEATYAGLWEAFLEQDISSVIPDIIDDKIYIIQSDLDKEITGGLTLTIGYKTASLDNIYEELQGIIVEASKYAVFETNKDASSLWNQIAFSDLETSNQNNVEVYHYNDKTQTIEKTDIWVAVPTTKSDLARLKNKSASATHKNITSSPTVSIQKSSERYTPESNNTSQSKETNATNMAGAYGYTEEEIAAYVKKFPTKKEGSFHVVGLQRKTNYNSEIEMSKAYEELWNDFLAKDYSKTKFIKDIDDKEHVYLVYSNYTENQVTLTLGYKTKSNSNFKSEIGLNAVTINANDYYNFELSGTSSDYEGEEWETLLEVLQYRAEESSDFEIYSFDKKYKVTEIQMWIATN